MGNSGRGQGKHIIFGVVLAVILDGIVLCAMHYVGGRELDAHILARVGIPGALLGLLVGYMYSRKREEKGGHL